MVNINLQKKENSINHCQYLSFLCAIFIGSVLNKCILNLRRDFAHNTSLCPMLKPYFYVKLTTFWGNLIYFISSAEFISFYFLYPVLVHVLTHMGREFPILFSVKCWMCNSYLIILTTDCSWELTVLLPQKLLTYFFQMIIFKILLISWEVFITDLYDPVFAVLFYSSLQLGGDPWWASTLHILYCISKDLLILL